MRIRIQTPLIMLGGTPLANVDEAEIAHGHPAYNLKLTATEGQTVQIPQADEYIFEIQVNGSESLTYVLRSAALEINQVTENGRQVTRIPCQ